MLTADLPFAIPVENLPAFDAHTIRRDSNGTSLVLRTGMATLRLLLLDNAQPGSPLAALVPLDATSLDRIEALARLWRTLNDRPAKPDTRLTKQRQRRLRQMLQAIDGHLDGASYREIGNVLYGKTRVAAHPWKSSALRDSTIALVRDGRHLIDGGYLELLRHRRRK